MNVLKPELIWIDGRCYRSLGNKDSESTHIFPYLENNDQIDLNYEEECSDIEIVPYGGTKFKHTFHVAKSFYRFIIGSKNVVRKRLETETGTTIQIPKIGEEGDIVIIGHDHKGIMTVVRRINLLINATRRRIQSTHFLSLPLNDGQIIMKFNMFKKDVLTNSKKTLKDINEIIFQTPSKLHLTLGILTLLDDAERNKAIEALNYCKEHIVKPIIEKHGQIHIRLQGIDIMNDDPTAVNVLYAKIDTNPVLQEIVDEIVNYYANIGLIMKEKDKVKLHVTLMNTSFRFRDEENGIKVSHTFDATEILETHKDTFFGEIVLKQIHLSQRHTISSNGYYQASAKINLSEDL